MGHPALQVLLFVTLVADLSALALSGVIAPGAGGLRPVWLVLPLGAALAGWALITRPLSRPDLSERARRRDEAIWPWVLAGAISWLGVAAAGLPPALGLLPIIPAMPQARRAFGLFATAEGFLTDPLNRMAHHLMVPGVAILFLFGFMQGGLDLGALAPTTWVALGALALGKPLGMVAVAVVLAARGHLPGGLSLRETGMVAGLSAAGFTVPPIVAGAALPGGLMQEAARLGIALAVLAGPLVVALGRRRG
jgi:NhaA family Na+:H+ antiporter